MYICTPPRFLTLPDLPDCMQTEQGGKVDLGEAPNSVASPREHLDFLRLFCSQIQMRRRHHGDEDSDSDTDQAQAGAGAWAGAGADKQARDEEMLSSSASFAEAQVNYGCM